MRLAVVWTAMALTGLVLGLATVFTWAGGDALRVTIAFAAGFVAGAVVAS